MYKEQKLAQANRQAILASNRGPMLKSGRCLFLYPIQEHAYNQSSIYLHALVFNEILTSFSKLGFAEVTSATPPNNEIL